MSDMRMLSDNIDHGKPFDWGRASKDYSRYRDIYPGEFYQTIVGLGICVEGQTVLDLGTGTGVLPRNLSRHGARFIGLDASAEQIAEAERLSAEQGISARYVVAKAEEMDFPDNAFDVVTACQCFFYFDKAVLMPKIARTLKPRGSLAILFMAWIPAENDIAGKSEKLVLEYNPSWTGVGWKRQPVTEPAWASEYGFRAAHKLAFDVMIPFTRESWNGRIRACRGVGASLSEEAIAAFDKEHARMLEQEAPDAFSIVHNVTMLVMENMKTS